MEREKSLGVVVGRFQLPALHQGHCDLLDYVTARHERTLVVCGYDKSWPQVRDLNRQPYPLAMQQQVVLNSYPDVLVEAIPDSGGRPKVWSSMLDDIIARVSGEAEATLYGSRDSFIALYSGRFSVVEVPPSGTYSATEIRERCAAVIVDDPMFRQGWLAALQHVRSCTQ